MRTPAEIRQLVTVGDARELWRFLVHPRVRTTHKKSCKRTGLAERSITGPSSVVCFAHFLSSPSCNVCGGV
ncbi:hypothetical protein M404DRAFT_487414 [Pisolithus tinctorius Marx 270]|uniref:Uncharacterized protein n=1 Tax=Pisolithus tinctorius Marx 270 TaxID=870435 RepID=A0A0C3NDE5_PISTI|nr:hypothetical protein M404DRAFT_487414 [Pisolithus tinctorius Marx 270]